MLISEGAEKFGKEIGIETVENSFFFTERRLNELSTSRQKNVIQLDHYSPKTEEKKMGTVGAVALDIHGNLAAATSTGGSPSFDLLISALHSKLLA